MIELCVDGTCIQLEADSNAADKGFQTLLQTTASLDFDPAWQYYSVTVALVLPAGYKLPGMAIHELHSLDRLRPWMTFLG